MEDGDSIGLIISLLTNNNRGQNINSWWIDIIILFILILINGFFSAAEFSIVSFNNNKINKLADEGNKSARRLQKLVRNPSGFLATIQVGVTFAGFLSSALASDKFAQRLIQLIDGGSSITWLKPVSMIVITIILSYFSLVLGELVPKRLALHDPQGIALKISGIIKVINTVLYPFTKLLTWSTNGVLRILGFDPNSNETAVTEDEIRMLLDASNQTGNIQIEEKKMIDNIFEFNDTEVSEIMTHRTNIEALQISSTLSETLKVCCDERFSRIPVYDENIDDIVGILHVKDMLNFMAKNDPKDFDLSKLIRQPLVSPETKSIDALFREMQKNHTQMAVVIDEYGGTAGIITIEDILEEIVGNIQDEYDEEEVEVVKNPDGTYLVDGMVAPDDVSEQIEWFNFNDEEDDYDTIAGYVIHLLDRIPDENECPEVRGGDVIFHVKEMDEKRISKVIMEYSPINKKTDDDSNKTEINS